MSPHALASAPRWLSAIALLLAPLSGEAQRVLGPALDATVLPRNMIRVTISPTWGRSHEQFAGGNGRTSRGAREPLAARFDVDSLNAAVLPQLGALVPDLQALLGTQGDPGLTLGPLRARVDASVATTPYVIEYGATRRLMLAVTVPVVSTWSEVALQPNTGGISGNVGINHAHFANDVGSAAARTRNLSVVTQLSGASQQLQQLLDTCTGSTATSCSAVNANRAGAQALVASATGAARGVENVFGVSATKPGARFAPTLGGSLLAAVNTRLAALATGFRGFLGAPVSDTSWISARPTGTGGFAYNGLQRLLTDSAFGVRADSLVSGGTTRLGDIEFGAKYMLLDSWQGQAPQRTTPTGFGYRLAVGATYRLGTGVPDSADQFADLGSGDGQSDIEGRLFLDLVFGRRFWVSAAARYARQQASDLVRRVPVSPTEAFPLRARRVLVTRDLGHERGLEVSPRMVLGDYIGAGVTWMYRSKSQDTYALADTAVANVPLQQLVAGTEAAEQRALFSLTYSNLTHYYQGRARMPMEISLTVGQTLNGHGGVARQSFTGLSLRVYNQLFSGR